MNKLIYNDLKNKTISYGSFLSDDGFILYKIVRKKEAHFYLEYTEEDNKYIVTCDKDIPLNEIEQYVKNNYKWVLNQWKKIDNPDPWYILGKLVNVKTIFGSEHKVIKNNEGIVIYLSNKKQFRDTAKAYLKTLAEDYLNKRVNELLNSLNLKASNINIKWFKHVWGRCWLNKQLDFNANLIQFDPKFIDSVIFHELAHLTYMNHSKNFHNLLESYFPNHRQINKEMNKWYLEHHLW